MAARHTRIGPGFVGDDVRATPRPVRRPSPRVPERPRRGGPSSAAPERVEGLRDLRRLGLAGSILLGVGALGAGALPMPNPLAGLRLIGLPARNPTICLAVAYAGLVIVVVAWARVALRLRAPQPPNRGELVRAATLWAAPLAIAPPLFSRDVYSYLAQGATLARGLDPYRLGPEDALGANDALVRGIPELWRHTPSPYGPLFLLLGRGLAAATGQDVVAGLLAYRLIALLGLALMVWALPRLARRAGVDPNNALWLGAANPLVLFHVISGAHNDGLMIGLMLAGLEIGLRGGRTAFVVGTALIVAASAVKAPAVLALPFLVLTAAQGWGGRFRDLVGACGLVAAIATPVYLLLSLATGVGLGATSALEVPGSVPSFLSVTTDLAVVAVVLGAVSGLGAHVEPVMTLFHATGVAAAGLLVLGSLLAVLRRGRDPVIGVAIGMAAVALLAVQTQPWYLLWALAPAAATDRPRLHRWLGVGCFVLAVLVPPTGDDFVARGFQLTNACAAAALLLPAAYTGGLLARRATPHLHPADITHGAAGCGGDHRRVHAARIMAPLRWTQTRNGLTGGRVR